MIGVESVQEYNDRKRSVQEESAKESGNLESSVAELLRTIENNKDAFAESFRHIYEKIDVKEEIEAMNSETSGQISSYVELYSLRTGIAIEGSWFAGCSNLIQSFCDDKSGFGRDFMKRLYSDSPEVKLIESGWIIEGLDSLLGKRWKQLTRSLIGRRQSRRNLPICLAEFPLTAIQIVSETMSSQWN